MQQQTISQLDCDVDEKQILYNDNQRWPAQCSEMRRSSNALPKVKAAPKKVHGHCLVVAACLIHYSFLNPGKTITSEKCAQQTDELHQRRQCLQRAPANRRDPALLHGNASHTPHSQRLQSWTNWATKYCLIHHIHLTSRQPTITSSSISTTFYRENASTTSRKQKMLSKSSSNPKFLHHRNKQIYVSLAKMCWLQWFLFD